MSALDSRNMISWASDPPPPQIQSGQQLLSVITLLTEDVPVSHPR
jgi:hypothetical protein